MVRIWIGASTLDAVVRLAAQMASTMIVARILSPAEFGMATLVLGGLGALAATRLRVLISYLVIVSAATLFIAFSVGTPQVLSAGLYYLPHSSFVAAALFLVADLIRRQRDAEAAKYEAIQQAEARKAEAEALRFAMEQEAEGIRAKGLAEAEAIEKKAEAQKKMGEASILEMYLNALPEVASVVRIYWV